MKVRRYQALARALLRSRGTTFRPASTFNNCPVQLSRALALGSPIDVHPEVQDALSNQGAVVALESAIITHGLPSPINLETARSVENIVRSTGAVPATIGIIDGRVKIGLHLSELERLSDSGENKALTKVSRRDIGTSIALMKDGGTTCSATLLFACMAGIKVFATGGLGGVHRGGESTMDVSADLQELSKSPVALVSAGVKSILDIGRTLEYLETLGVPVLTYGSTDDFPAFYSSKSGFKSPWRVDNPRTVADIMRNQWNLGIENGILVGVPIPERFQVEAAGIQDAVEQAIQESEENGMSKKGKEVTPWLLSRVGELTGGRSIRSNIALIENTAAVGGKIAVEYANSQLGRILAGDHHPLHVQRINKQKLSPDIRLSTDRDNDGSASKHPIKLMVVGASAVDITSTATCLPDMTGKPNLSANSTARGVVNMTVGGVGRNVAEAAHKILSSSPEPQPHATSLLSPIGDDGFGRLLLEEHLRLGMRTEGFVSSPASRTAVCNMVLDASGGLIGGVADMEIIEKFDPHKILQFIRGRSVPTLIAMDGNLSHQTLASVLTYCHENGVPSLYEPTSVVKSVSILPAVSSALDRAIGTLAPVTYASPNLLELSQMYHAACSEPLDLCGHKVWWSIVDNFGLGSEWRSDMEQLARQSASHVSKVTLSFLVNKGIAQMAINLLPFFQHLVIKCGELGAVVAMRVSQQHVKQTTWAQMRSNPLEHYAVARSLDDKEVIVIKHFPAMRVEKDSIVNVTGAGDSLVGALCAGLVQNPDAFRDPDQVDNLIRHAQEAAVMSLQCHTAVSPLLGNSGVRGL